ncbi:glycosyltransferase family 4 protein [Geobacter pelophilus]|uniref:Glycosyltransferase family 4 protein n=1 Tax=Geoanaerobacter pelophilus TaxID=60036 RepID=A0AAW4L492_9BACT|nr:glycosyltransferase family 4 protein [Geoanaerobacter pelophilus]MBT0663415.1 glycosyltransferase family 4 protein [Geoanaerobacter pelophilus]
MADSSVRLKVAVIAPCPFYIDRGTPLRIRRLAEAMSTEFDIRVISFFQGEQGCFPFRIHRTVPLPLTIKRTGANMAKLLYDILLLWTVLRVVREERIRVIDGHLHEGALIGIIVRLLTGARVIYNAHGTFVPELIATGTISAASPLIKPLAKFERWIERRVDRIVAQSILRRDEFIAAGHDADKIVLVEDVPELDSFYLHDEQVDRELERRLRPNNEKLLIYSGGMEEYQGVDFLLEAFRRVVDQRDDVRLVLFGRPLPPYRTIAGELGIAHRISFVDNEPFERLPQYLKICDIGFCLRLYGDNVPGKLPVYLASGIAVIGTDIKGVNTVVTHDCNGLLVPPGDVDALVAVIDRLVDMPEDIRRLGESGRAEAVRRYDPVVAYAELAKVYRDLMQ